MSFPVQRGNEGDHLLPHGKKARTRRDGFPTNSIASLANPATLVATLAALVLLVVFRKSTIGLTSQVGELGGAYGVRTPITFTVHLCGVSKEVWDRHVPWPVCRVKLVGCPKNGGDCWHWRYHEGLEMTPTGDDRNTFTITTDMYVPGDSYGFAVIEGGCTVDDEVRGGCVSSAGEDAPQDCKLEELCDHRYDSGTATETVLGDPLHNITCWRDTMRCSTASPFAQIPFEDRTCLREPGGYWLNRVLPQSAADSGEISAVWGSCESTPSDTTQCMNTDAPSLCPAANAPDGTTASPTPLSPSPPPVTPTSPTPPPPSPLPPPSPPPAVDCTNLPDGTKCGDMSTDMKKSTCCNKVCCADGQFCQASGIEGEPSTCAALTDSSAAICPSGDSVPSIGVCTQSCGSGNGDCDQTCAAARDAGEGKLTCTIGSSGGDQCKCSQVGGGTSEECGGFPNPGWKCCTCKDIE